MQSIVDLLQPTQSCVCSAYRKASRAVTQHYEAAFRGSGLRATQFTILSTLAQAGPTPISQLASHLGLERTTLTRNFTLLVDRELVQIGTAEDARVRVATITSAGEDRVRELLPRWQAAQDTVDHVLKQLTI